jgi:hypothetical protein
MSYLTPKKTKEQLEALEDVTDGDGADIAFTSATMKGHIIPSVHASGHPLYDGFDIGSAEYKVRHLFLSDSSLWIGDSHKIDTADGSLKARKMNTTNHASFTPDGVANIVHTYLREFDNHDQAGALGITLSQNPELNFLPEPFTGLFGNGVSVIGYNLAADHGSYVVGYQQAARNEIFRRAFDYPKQAYLDEIANMKDLVQAAQDAGEAAADLTDLQQQTLDQRIQSVAELTAYNNAAILSNEALGAKTASLISSVGDFAQTLSVSFPEVTLNIHHPQMMGTMGTLGVPQPSLPSSMGSTMGIGQQATWGLASMMGTLGTIDTSMQSMGSTMGTMQGSLPILNPTNLAALDGELQGEGVGVITYHLTLIEDSIEQQRQDLKDLYESLEETEGSLNLLVYNPSSLKDWKGVLQVLGSTFLTHQLGGREWDHATKAVVHGLGLGPMKFSDMYEKVEDLFGAADFETEAVTSYEGRFRTAPSETPGDEFTISVLEWDLPTHTVHGGTVEVLVFTDGNGEPRKRASHYTGNFIVSEGLDEMTGADSVTVDMSNFVRANSQHGSALQDGETAAFAVVPRLDEHTGTCTGMILQVSTKGINGPGPGGGAEGTSWMGVAKVNLTIY